MANGLLYLIVFVVYYIIVNRVSIFYISSLWCLANSVTKTIDDSYALGAIKGNVTCGKTGY